jgi:hypothetical protein
VQRTALARRCPACRKRVCGAGHARRNKRPAEPVLAGVAEHARIAGNTRGEAQGHEDVQRLHAFLLYVLYICASDISLSKKCKQSEKNILKKHSRLASRKPAQLEMSSPPDYDSASKLPASTASRDLEAFWKMHDLADEQDTINKYLGTRFIQDLDYVTTNDMRTISFRTWAEHTISIVAKNRLVQAIENYPRATTVVVD